jgi:hypothetical protein
MSMTVVKGIKFNRHVLARIFVRLILMPKYFNAVKQKTYRALVEKPEERRPLGRPRCRWKDNIKMDLREVEYGTRTESIWARIGTGGGFL